MSDPCAKAARAKIKTIRQGGIDQKERLRAISKKDKPFIVEYSWKSFSYGWRNIWPKKGAYRSLAEAEKVMRDLERKRPGFYKTRLRTEK